MTPFETETLKMFEEMMSQKGTVVLEKLLFQDNNHSYTLVIDSRKISDFLLTQLRLARADERKKAYEDGKNAACEKIRTAFLSMEPWIPEGRNTAWLPRNVVEIAIENARKA